MAGTDRYIRSTSHRDSALDKLTTAINVIVDEINTFVTQWNLKQGGASVVIATIGAYKVLGVAIPTPAADTSPATVEVDDGDSQSTTPATDLSTDLSVVVKDSSGTVVNGATVAWTSTDPDAVFSAQSITDATGITTIPYTTGFTAGVTTVTASVDGAGSVDFTITVIADVAATLAANSTTDQSGTTSTAVGTPPSVKVTDAYGNPVEGETVTFAVTAGSGSRSPATVDTGADGIATLTSWTLGASAGLNTLTATVSGLSGSPVTFNANASASTPTQIAVTSGGTQTGIVAGQAASATTWTVKDAGNNAVQGVTVAFDVASGSGSLSVDSAVTNASGQVSVTYTTHTTVETATIRGSFNSGAVSASTTIASTFGTASKLALQTQPSSSGDSGTALSQQPIVLVQDANGNTVTSSTATITASIQSGNATISAGSSKAAVAGVATFTALTLVDTDGGANVIRFSSGALTVVDSSGTTLAPPVPVAVQFQTQPNDATVGTGGISCTAWVVDSGNILVTSATNAITVALTTPGGATLSGTLTVNASGGIATFTGLTVDTVGTYTLTATASGLTSAVSASFTISAASADPYEPAGYSQIAYRPFTTNDEDGWTPVIGASAIRTDATAPTTPSGVLRFNKTNNGATSFNPGRFDKSITARDAVYFRCAIKLSAGFLANTSLVNKVGPFFGLEGGVQMFLDVHGTGSGTLYWHMRAQGCPPSLGPISSSGDANMGGTSAPCVRDRWYIVRCQMVRNTYNVADGILNLWVEDTTTGTVTQVLNRTNMAYIGSGTSPATTSSSKFDRVFLNAIHGGGAEDPGADTNIYIDDYYVSAP